METKPYICEECGGTGIRERVWDSAPLVCWNCDGFGQCVVEVEAPDEYEPIVVTRIIDARPTAEVDAAWARFRERVTAMGKSWWEVEK